MHIGLSSSAKETTHDRSCCGHGKASDFHLWHLPECSSENGIVPSGKHSRHSSAL